MSNRHGKGAKQQLRQSEEPPLPSLTVPMMSVPNFSEQACNTRTGRANRRKKGRCVFPGLAHEELKARELEPWNVCFCLFVGLAVILRRAHLQATRKSA